jgi:cytochrome c oxidase subunit 2
LFYHKNNPIASNITHGTTIEIIWTVTPSIILMVIAVPSFALLYSIDEVIDPAITLKVIGHQWYWSYEYSDYSDIEGNSISFDSYMTSDDDLESGQIRLLEVDNRVVLPANTHVRALVTATDVLHSWAIPSLGVKMDACPGRLNQVSIFIKRQGTFFGQCSELCGVQHGFMPIVIEAVSVEDYIKWVSVQTECKNWLSNKFKVLDKN